MGVNVERTANEVVLNLRIGGANILVAHLFRKRNRFTIIEVFTVGRPCGINLKQGGIVRNDTHRVSLNIVEYQVAGLIINLNLIRI